MKKKILVVVLWTLCILMAVLFIPSGFPKIVPEEAMLNRFARWGYPGWFATVIGIVELLGGILILIPRTTLYAAGALMVVMLGAVYTHISSGIGGPSFALIAFLVLGITAFLRWKLDSDAFKENENQPSSES